MLSFKKAFSLLLVCCFANYSFSQQPSFTETPSIKFGFALAINHTEPVPDFKGHFGFSNGIVAEYPLSNKFFFYAEPSLTFLAYKRLQKSGGEQYLEFTQIEFPLMLSAKPFGKKIKPVFSAGPDFKYDLSGKNSNRAIDVSIGIEKQLEYCSFIPSVRYSYGREMKAFYFSVCFKG